MRWRHWIFTLPLRLRSLFRRQGEEHRGAGAEAGEAMRVAHDRELYREFLARLYDRSGSQWSLKLAGR